MNNRETKIFANAFNLIPSIGPVKLLRLFKFFNNDLEQAWNAASTQYISAGIDQKTIDQIIANKSAINPAQAFKALEKQNIEMLLFTDPSYPKLLTQIPTFPPLLYVRGRVKSLNQTCIAVVGTRKMTIYGRQGANHIVTGLVEAGLNIVSGLAFGVDAQVLSECIKLGGVPIAVLASSLDNASISPRANFNLSQKIIEHGALISEYPLGASVQKQNFPIRNRIIAGMSLGTVVIEADDESGALITAAYALEQNREVFALPGSIFSPVSRGTNNLIKKGAVPISSVADIVEQLNLDIKLGMERVELGDESREEETILQNLTREPLHIDDLIKAVKLSVAEVNTALTLLEMKGRIKNLGGAKYVRVR